MLEETADGAIDVETANLQDLLLSNILGKTDLLILNDSS